MNLGRERRLFQGRALHLSSSWPLEASRRQRACARSPRERGRGTRGAGRRGGDRGTSNALCVTAWVFCVCDRVCVLCSSIATCRGWNDVYTLMTSYVHITRMMCINVYMRPRPNNLCTWSHICDCINVHIIAYTHLMCINVYMRPRPNNLCTWSHVYINAHHVCMVSTHGSWRRSEGCLCRCLRRPD